MRRNWRRSVCGALGLGMSLLQTSSHLTVSCSVRASCAPAGSPAIRPDGRSRRQETRKSFQARWAGADHRDPSENGEQRSASDRSSSRWPCELHAGRSARPPGENGRRNDTTSSPGGRPPAQTARTHPARSPCAQPRGTYGSVEERPAAGQPTASSPPVRPSVRCSLRCRHQTTTCPFTSSWSTYSILSHDNRRSTRSAKCPSDQEPNPHREHCTGRTEAPEGKPIEPPPHARSVDMGTTTERPGHVGRHPGRPHCLDRARGR